MLIFNSLSQSLSLDAPVFFLSVSGGLSRAFQPSPVAQGLGDPEPAAKASAAHGLRFDILYSMYYILFHIS